MNICDGRNIRSESEEIGRNEYKDNLIAISPQIASGFMKTLYFASRAKIEMKENQKVIDGNTMYYYYKAKTEL